LGLSIVVLTPAFQLLLGFSQTKEQVGIQTLISQSPVKTLDKGVLQRFSWTDEVELDLVQVSAGVRLSRHELGAVIHGDSFWKPAFCLQLFKVSITRSALNEKPATSARHSRLYRSRIVRMRKPGKPRTNIFFSCQTSFLEVMNPGFSFWTRRSGLLKPRRSRRRIRSAVQVRQFCSQLFTTRNGRDNKSCQRRRIEMTSPLVSFLV